MALLPLFIRKSLHLSVCISFFFSPLQPHITVGVSDRRQPSGGHFRRDSSSSRFSFFFLFSCFFDATRVSVGSLPRENEGKYKLLTHDNVGFTIRFFNNAKCGFRVNTVGFNWL